MYKHWQWGVSSQVSHNECGVVLQYEVKHTEIKDIVLAISLKIIGFSICLFLYSIFGPCRTHCNKPEGCIFNGYGNNAKTSLCILPHQIGDSGQ